MRRSAAGRDAPAAWFSACRSAGTPAAGAPAAPSNAVNPPRRRSRPAENRRRLTGRNQSARKPAGSCARRKAFACASIQRGQSAPERAAARARGETIDAPPEGSKPRGDPARRQTAPGSDAQRPCSTHNHAGRQGARAGRSQPACGVARGQAASSSRASRAPASSDARRQSADGRRTRRQAASCSSRDGATARNRACSRAGGNAARGAQAPGAASAEGCAPKFSPGGPGATSDRSQACFTRSAPNSGRPRSDAGSPRRAPAPRGSPADSGPGSSAGGTRSGARSPDRATRRRPGDPSPGTACASSPGCARAGSRAAARVAGGSRGSCPGAASRQARPRPGRTGQARAATRLSRRPVRCRRAAPPVRPRQPCLPPAEPSNVRG